jgi:hypothetical protein
MRFLAFLSFTAAAAAQTAIVYGRGEGVPE